MEIKQKLSKLYLLSFLILAVGGIDYCYFPDTALAGLPAFTLAELTPQIYFT